MPVAVPSKLLLLSCLGPQSRAGMVVEEEARLGSQPIVAGDTRRPSIARSPSLPITAKRFPSRSQQGPYRAPITAPLARTHTHTNGASSIIA